MLDIRPGDFVDIETKDGVLHNVYVRMVKNGKLCGHVTMVDCHGVKHCPDVNQVDVCKVVNQRKGSCHDEVTY